MPVEYRTHTWEAVARSFARLGREVPRFAPLGAAVAEVATSRYAAGLFPVQSMHTLLLYQHDRAGPGDDQLRLDWDGEQFVVQYLAGAKRDPRFALQPQARVWTKRGPAALPLLERAFHHLRWFVEYHDPTG